MAAIEEPAAACAATRSPSSRLIHGKKKALARPAAVSPPLPFHSSSNHRRRLLPAPPQRLQSAPKFSILLDGSTNGSEGTILYVDLAAGYSYRSAPSATPVPISPSSSSFVYLRQIRMLRQLSSRCSTIITPLICHSAEKVHSCILGERPLPINFPSHTFLRTFLDFRQFRNKEAIAKERARLSDEISRGYFADMSEIHKNNGKIALADKTIIPSLTAAKFPDLEINFSDGRCEKLPSNPEQRINDSGQTALPCVTLLSLSFRASSQKMVESWSLPVLNAFGDAGTVKIYEVSFIDSWLFSLSPVKRLFLKIMLKSSNPQRQIVYSFGDHYYFRKKLQILNLLTGYTFLLDSSGRIRWQGYGYATEEEVSWLLSCISLLLDVK